MSAPVRSLFCHRIWLPFLQNFGSFFAWLSILFRHRIVHRLLVAFLMDFDPKTAPKNAGRGSPFDLPNRYFSAGGPFEVPLVRFGSLLAPFGLHFGCFLPILVFFWLNFGFFSCLWAPFWSLLVPFLLHLTPLGTKIDAKYNIYVFLFKKHVFLAPDLRNSRIYLEFH